MNKMHALVENHLGYATRIARRQCWRLPRRFSLEELQAAAYLGLVEAARRFDEGQRVSFTTFAYPRVFGAIMDYVRECGRGTVSLDQATDDEGTPLGATLA